MCSCTPVPSRARGHRLFEETQKVEFAITQGPPGPKGPQATNVRPVAYGGIPDFRKPEVLTRSGALGARRSSLTGACRDWRGGGGGVDGRLVIRGTWPFHSRRDGPRRTAGRFPFAPSSEKP